MIIVENDHISSYRERACSSVKIQNSDSEFRIQIQKIQRPLESG